MDKLEFRSKRREQTLNFIKFLLGTFFLGLFAAIINNSIQKAKLDLEAQKFESEHLSRFTHLFVGASNQEKRDFIFFMQHLSFTEDKRAQYRDLHEAIQTEIDTVAELSNQLVESLERESNIISKKQELEKKQIILNRNLQSARNRNVKTNKFASVLSDSLDNLMVQQQSLDSILQTERKTMQDLKAQLKIQKEKDEGPAKYLAINENVLHLDMIYEKTAIDMASEKNVIRVKIIDEKTGFPISDVSVTVKGHFFELTVLTNIEGFALFGPVEGFSPSSTTEIYITKKGYEPALFEDIYTNIKYGYIQIKARKKKNIKFR